MGQGCQSSRVAAIFSKLDYWVNFSGSIISIAATNHKKEVHNEYNTTKVIATVVAIAIF